MQHFRAINTWVGLSLALMLSTGCAWRGPKSPTGLAPTSSRAEDLGKNGARRVEAQARYASGLAHELRREPDKALEEFILSVRADPSNEELALDVSRQLVLAKDLTRALELAELAAK